MTKKDFEETTPYTRKLMARYLGESCVGSSIRCAKAYLNDIVRIECVFLSYENARSWGMQYFDHQGNDITAEQTTDKTDANAYFQLLIHSVGKNWKKEAKEAV